jgi:hypothetical protein
MDGFVDISQTKRTHRVIDTRRGSTPNHVEMRKIFCGEHEHSLD